MPSLKLKPARGPVGTNITAMGTGFRPNVSYRLQLEHIWLKPGTTNNRGGFTAVFRIPPVAFGDQDITAVSKAAHQVAHSGFRVEPQIVRVEPEEIVPGEVIAVSGTGLGNREPVQVRIGDRDVSLATEVRTDVDGTFTVEVAVADDLVLSSPVVIAVIGKDTGASAQIARGIRAKLAS
jgi:hypothetical protein